MIDERAEFAAYTGAVVYDVTNKQDSAYLGRFIFDTLLRGEGLQRILTIVARGYLWQTDKPDIDRARDALRAWCSIPDSKKAKPKEAWQYETDFRQLHDEFPELVDNQGNGWFVRHVHGVRDFLKHHPEKVSKPALKNLEALSHGWDAHWRDKVIRFQIPLFSPETKGGWVLRFDDILADALELGPLRSPTLTLPPGLEQRLADSFPSAKSEVLLTLLEYYVANKQEGSPWVVLPVANFDAYFGTTAFSRKWLAQIPAEFIEIMAHLARRPVSVIGQAFHNYRHAGGAIPLVCDFFVICAVVIPRRLFDASEDGIVRHIIRFRLCNRILQLGIGFRVSAARLYRNCQLAS